MDSESPLPVVGKLDEFFLNLKNHWNTALQNSVTKMFTDPTALITLIDLGATFQDEIEDTPININYNVTRAMIVVALPFAWDTSSEPIYSVVINDVGLSGAGSDCGSVDPSKSKIASSPDLIVAHYDGSVVSDTRVCDGNDAYCKFTSIKSVGAALTSVQSW